MKFTKLTSVLVGLFMLAATALPIQTSALGVASMTMEGAHSSNGSFSFIVYENSGSDTVTGAKVELSFNQPVSNLAYDYSVGPFTTATPSGMQLSKGPVTGSNPVARVSFTVSAPGTVIADVSTASYLKHVEGTAIQDFSFEKGQAYFTYDAPAPKPAVTRTSAPAETTPAPTTPTDTPAPLDSEQDVKSADTKKSDKTKSSSVNLTTSLILVLLVGVAVVGYWLGARKRGDLTPAKAYKLKTEETSTKKVSKAKTAKSAAKKKA